MVEPLDEIYLIPVGDEHLLHAPLHRVTALVNESAAGELQEVLARRDLSGVDAKLEPLARQLLEGHTFVPTPKRGAFAPDHLAMILTNDCNLRCAYCAPAAGDTERLIMSRDVCVAALDFLASIVARDGLTAFNIYFHGGEPFLRWEFMQFCIAEAQRRADRLGVPLRATATTNAFLSPDQAAWVAEHFSFLNVSMDGPPAVHDAFRPTVSGRGSFQVVARSVRIFRERGLRFMLRSAVDSTTVSRMAEIAEFFCRELKPPEINFEPLVVTGRCKKSGLRAPSPADYAQGAMAAGIVARSYGVRYFMTGAQTDRLARSCCDVADDLFLVTPDGLVSTCFSANDRASAQCEPFVIGEFDATRGRFELHQDRLERIRTFGVEDCPRCQRCFCKWHCSGGCRVFHTPPFCDEPPLPRCASTQKLTLWKLLCDIGREDLADDLLRDDESATHGTWDGACLPNVGVAGSGSP